MSDEYGVDGNKSGLHAFISLLPPWARSFVAIGFIFTIWSVFTGFNLGDIMNKFADSALKQNEMQFQAQMEIDKLRLTAANESNDKLDSLVLLVEGVTVRMDKQAERITALSKRMAKVESTLTSVVTWTCTHEKSDDVPGYCLALNLKDDKQ